MRTLSSTLTSAQKSPRGRPLYKIVLSRTGQTTRGYDNSRIIKISRTEEPNSHKTDIILQNADGALTTLDFEHYQAVISKGYKTGVSRTAWAAGTVYAIDDIRVPVTANGYQYRCSVAGTSHATTEPTWPTDLGVTVTDGTVTWEMDGNSSDEYSRAAPLRVRIQELHSGIGLLRCILRCTGLQDQMKEDKAKATYTQTSGDTNTVKTLISAVCAAGAGLSGAYNGYTAITVAYDSEDSLIDTFIPADYFSISKNESRWDRIEWLLANTGCKARFQNDGKLHILDPVISGVVYDYEYKFNVSGDHNFWNKSVRLRFVEPNEEIVKTADGITPAYSGSATSATSYALDPKTHTTTGRFVSNAQCAAIAAAMIERYELDDEKGFAVVPPNVGQELWDYVKVTDSRQGDTRIGNIQFIQDVVELFPGTERRSIWTMMFAFGKTSLLSLMSNMLSSGEGGDGAARLTNAQIFELFDGIVDYLEKQSIKTVWLEESAPDNLDDIANGISYQRLLATQISAGKIYLSDVSTFMAGYDPSGKRRVFTATPTTPYDVGDLWADGTVVKRCTTARASGAYVAGDWTQLTIDEMADGVTYQKVLATNISSGNINLFSGTVKTGEWYDVSGVEIDATHGINIYGTDNALTTRATKTGTIQCYVGADGVIRVAGDGLFFLAPGAPPVDRGYMYGTTSDATDGTAFVIRSRNATDLKLFAQTTGKLLLQSGRGNIEITPSASSGSSVTKITRLDTTVDETLRAKDTIYQNTTGKLLLVIVSVIVYDGGWAIAQIGSTSPPSSNIAHCANDDPTIQNKMTLTFIVPVNYYYRILENSVTMTIYDWVEETIG